MNTIGWLFILTAAWLVRAVFRGQVIDATGKFVLLDNLSASVLGIVTNNPSALRDANSAEGQGIIIAGEQGGSDEADWNGTGNFGGTVDGSHRTVKIKNGPVTPKAQAGTNVIASKFGISDSDISTYNGHLPSRERAVDVFVGVAQGNAASMYGRAHAAELGITQIIWNKKIWTAARDSEGWRKYKPITNKGDYNHEKHIHFTY